MLGLNPCVAMGLERAPVGVGAGTDADEARDEDSGSGNECDQCEVHVVLLWRARPGHRDCGALLRLVDRDVESVRAVVRS